MQLPWPRAQTHLECVFFSIFLKLFQQKERGKWNKWNRKSDGKHISYKANRRETEGLLLSPAQEKKDSSPQQRCLHHCPWWWCLSRWRLCLRFHLASASQSAVQTPAAWGPGFSPFLPYMSHNLQGMFKHFFQPRLLHLFHSSPPSTYISYSSLNLVLSLTREGLSLYFNTLGNWVLVFPNSVSTEMSPKQFRLKQDNRCIYCPALSLFPISQYHGTVCIIL